jgi:hypothetical protein
VIDAKIANTVKYSAESIAAYQTAINAVNAGVTVGDQTKSQAFIDNKLATLKEKESILELHSYTITFITNVDGNVTSTNITASYNELVNLAYEDEGSVYKWTNDYTGVERTITPRL